MAALKVNGWTILFHRQMVDQLEGLAETYRRALEADPETAPLKPQAKLLAAVSDHILRVVPENPADRRFEQGNTIGQEHRGWRRVKIFQRFRLFFRFHSPSRTIVFAWLNDEGSLRARGSRDDVYRTFKRMLERGNPPSDWSALVKRSGHLPDDLREAVGGLADGA